MRVVKYKPLGQQAQQKGQNHSRLKPAVMTVWQWSQSRVPGSVRLLTISSDWHSADRHNKKTDEGRQNMSTVKETVSPRAVKNVEKERKEHSRDGKTLRQLCNVTPGYKPEKCSNCGCTRKFSPCTCLRKVKP